MKYLVIQIFFVFAARLGLFTKFVSLMTVLHFMLLSMRNINSLTVAFLAALLGFCVACFEPADTQYHKVDDRSSITSEAWRLRDDGGPIDSCIALQRMAVEELRRGDSPDDAVTVLAQMGLFLYGDGDLSSALAFYHEAADSLAVTPQNLRSEGAIQLFGNMSLLYERIYMFDKAFEWSDSAIAECKRQGGRLLSDVYRFRAGCYNNKGELDKALECYDLALNAIDNSNSNADKGMLRSVIDGERAYFLLENFGDCPDSVDRAVKLLERSIENYGDEYESASRQLSLGMGYVLQGKKQQGLKLMEDAAAEIRRQGELEMIDYANCVLFESYATLGEWQKLAELYPDYHATRDSMTRIEHHDNIIAANVSFDVQNKERTIEMQNLMLKMTHQRTVLVVISASLILVLLIIVVATLVARRKIERRRYSEQTDIDKKRIKTLEQNLEAGRNSNNDILATPQFITRQMTGAFRRAFDSLYPDFTPRLKAAVPELTANDELLCMLIFLRHTTDEIAVYLGISRASVNSARYRLRTKMGLAKSENLDSYIIALINPA